MTLLKEVNAKNINISLLSLEARINELANSASGSVNLDDVYSQLSSLSARVERIEQESDISSLVEDIRQLDRQIIELRSSITDNTIKINTEISDRQAADTALQNNIDNKVDKVSGKGLSTNDFTDADKAKLDSLQNTVVDSALSSTSTNPVQNKVIDAALNNKVDKESGKELSSNDFTDADKTKLDGIETGANKTVVDTALSSTSTSPVQNKVVNAALDSIKKDHGYLCKLYSELTSSTNNSTNQSYNVMLLGKIPDPASTAAPATPSGSWDIDIDVYFVRSVGHKAAWCNVKAGYGYSNAWRKYGFIETFGVDANSNYTNPFELVTLKYNNEWYIGIKHFVNIDGNYSARINNVNSNGSRNISTVYNTPLSNVLAIIPYKNAANTVLNSEINSSIVTFPDTYAPDIKRNGKQILKKLVIDDTADVTLSSFGSEPLSIGTSSGANLGLDANEIQARNNGATAPLYLNGGGGETHIGTSGVFSSDGLSYNGKAAETVVDTALSSTSTKPVQNKVVTAALAGKQDNLVTKTYTLPTLTSSGTRYIKLATFSYDKSASFSIEMRGVNLIEHIDININSGNGTTPSISGHYATNLGYAKRIICHPTTNSWDTTFEVWLEYTQYTTCTVYLSYDKKYESYINTNSTLNVTTSSTSGVNYYLPYNSSTKGGVFGRVNCESLWSGTSSTGAQTITLAKSILSFSFILVAGLFYTSGNEQKQTLLIPVSEAMYNLTNTAWMMCGSTGGTDRRLRFGFSSPSVLTKYESVGSSGHLPVITNVWGIL